MGIFDSLFGGTGAHPMPATPGTYTWDGQAQREPLSGAGGAGGVSPTLLALLSGIGQIGAKLAPDNPMAQTGTVAAGMAQPILADAAKQVTQNEALTALPPGGTATAPTPQPSALGPVAPQQAAPVAPITAAPTTSALNTAPGATPASFSSAPTSSATSTAPATSFSPQMHMWLGGLTPESYHAAVQEADAAINRADRVHQQVLENLRLDQQMKMEQERLGYAKNADTRAAAQEGRDAAAAPTELAAKRSQAAITAFNAQPGNLLSPQQEADLKIKTNDTISKQDYANKFDEFKREVDEGLKRGAKGGAGSQTEEQLIKDTQATAAAIAANKLKYATGLNDKDFKEMFSDPTTGAYKPDFHVVVGLLNDALTNSGRFSDPANRIPATKLPEVLAARDGMLDIINKNLPEELRAQVATGIPTNNALPNNAPSAKGGMAEAPYEPGPAPAAVTGKTTSTLGTLKAQPDPTPTPVANTTLLPASLQGVKLPPPGMKLEIKNAAGQVLYHIDYLGNKVP